MPRFKFNVHNGNGVTRDDEGSDAADQADARRIALESIRSFIAEEARGGLIDLRGHVEITNEDDESLVEIAFSEAFDLRVPGMGR